MAKVILLHVNSTNKDEVKEKLNKHQLNYEMGETKSIYSLGLGIQKMLVQTDMNSEELNTLLGIQ